MRLFNAILAALLFPMVDLLETIILVPLQTAYFLTSSIHHAISAYRRVGPITAVAAFAATLAMLFFPAIHMLILMLILIGVYNLNPIALYLFVICPMVKGFYKGWDGDVTEGFSYAKSRFQAMFSDYNLPALFQGHVVASTFLERVLNARWLARPMDELVADRATEFAALQLSQPEWEQLQVAQAPLLTENEMLHLESIDGLQTQVSAYKVCFNRLEVENCPLFLGRPEKTNTVLLTKQYRSEDHSRWLPVPNQSYVFDKEQLQNALAIQHEMTHSITRDVISRPSAYHEHPDAQTRYVWHPYYVNADSSSGISQELSGKALHLRAHLAQMPRLATAASVSPVVTLESMTKARPLTRNEQDRAKRLAFFEKGGKDNRLPDGFDSPPLTTASQSNR